MGRRPKDAPKGAPKRLTQKQYELLSHILNENYGTGEGKPLVLDHDIPVIWSPKVFLERSATKSESATLSRRVATLNRHGLIEKSGRYVKVTNTGRALLDAYLLEHEGNDLELYKTRLVLDIIKSVGRLTTIQNTLKIAREYGMSELLTTDKEVLPDLLIVEAKRVNQLAESLLEATRLED